MTNSNEEILPIGYKSNRIVENTKAKKHDQEVLSCFWQCFRQWILGSVWNLEKGKEKKEKKMEGKCKEKVKENVLCL